MREGRGTGGILPVRKCPLLGSGWEERYPRAGGCGRHGHLADPRTSMLGNCCPRSPSRAPGVPTAPGAPHAPARRGSRSLKLPFPGPRLNAPKCTAEFTARGCLDCPSAESSLCARRLFYEEFVIIIVTHLQLKFAFCLRQEFSSTFEETSPPHTSHTHSPNRVLCFVKDNSWKKVFKDTFLHL